LNKKSALILSCALAVVATLARAQSAPAPVPIAAPTTAPQTGASSTARAGTVKSVQGDVWLVGGNAVPRAASAGDAVAAVDRIRTGPGAGAGVVLRDGTSIVVGPSSELDLKDFRFDATTQDGGLLVSLLRGSLRMVSGLIGKNHPEAVRVETPTAVIGIRGTDFIVETTGTP
jgi:hypothetical protein